MDDDRMRYTDDEYARNVFYQMPKFLFNEEFQELSNDAKVLYALLRDRHILSQINGWKNSKGEFYLIMTRDSMCNMLHTSLKTAIKTMNELKKHRLFEEERQGQGKPNIIYLLQVKQSTYQTCNYYRSEPEKNTGLDVKKLQPNNTINNKNNINNTLSGKAGKKKRENESEKHGSFDTEESFKAALKKSYGDDYDKIFNSDGDIQ